MGRYSELLISPVERAALKESAFDFQYLPEEKLPAIVVDNIPLLGRLAALRFIEWAQGNPGGVMSLPTGKTPEYFIKWMQWILGNWNTKDVLDLLAGNELSSRKPDLQSLYFVQIDEFYPMNPLQVNSFNYYVNNFYIKGLGLDPAKCLLMDCSRIGMGPDQSTDDIWPDNRVDLSLRFRTPETVLENIQRDALLRVDQWCLEHEDRIRALGGIGFFLGGIGPDGHIGFNIRGSDHHCTTRLTGTNYETQAAVATDLGGVDISRNRLVITIGLETITFNPDCTVIIIAAGASKAEVIARAIEGQKCVDIPASAFHTMPNARFFLTKGAAGLLQRRQYQVITKSPEIGSETIERVIIDCALSKCKRVIDLTEEDLKSDTLGEAVLHCSGKNLHDLVSGVKNRLQSAVEAGTTVAQNVRFLHTEPHHDDIMLGYLPAAVRHVRSAANRHVFATLTSGFTAVTNRFMLEKLSRALEFIDQLAYKMLSAEGYFTGSNRKARNRDIWQYLDGVTSEDRHMQAEGESRRLIRDLGEIYGSYDVISVKAHIQELISYFRNAYPGKRDPEEVQRLKGMCREWEAECLWGYFGWNSENVHHLRLGFYTGDIFNPEPTQERDVAPVAALLSEVNPDIVTVALDPEGSGPDTHYKALQTVADALRVHSRKTGRKEIKVWGYRNVWYRFHPSEANKFVPVSLNMFAVMKASFTHSFVSQKDAPFPSYEYDGPFCDLAQKIQVDQYHAVKTCLGREWFYEHSSPLIRATRGFVYLKEMSLEELYSHTRELAMATENFTAPDQ